MSFSTMLLIAIGVAVFLVITQTLVSREKSEQLKKEFSSGKPPFVISDSFQMPANAITHTPEAIEALQNNLQQEEVVFSMALGYVGIKPGILVATQSRVIRLSQQAKALSGYSADIEALTFNEISNVLMEKHAFHLLKIVGKSGTCIELTKIFEPAEAKHFADYVNSHLRSQVVITNRPQANESLLLRIAKDGQDLGAMPLTKVRILLSSGHLSSNDFYLDEQLNQWIELQHCDLLIT